jgi:phosphomannomutase
MLTASHNPPAYHGFKLKGPYGGTATPDIYKAVSERVAAIAAADIRPFDAKRHAIETFDIQAAYYDAVQKLLDLEALKAIDFPVWHEAMGGAGTGWLSGFFNYAGLRQSITEIHSKADPLFYGVNPEPLPINLGESMALVKNEARGLVICSDGDADRIAAVLPAGRFFNPHQIFAVLLHHLHHKGLSGKVVKTFTASRVIERLAKARGLEVIETPVGFKYIVDAMLAGGILIGGEESGGIGVAGHIPERDSLANGLLLLELMVKSGKNPAELFSEIEEEVAWQHSYDRLDLHLSGNALKDAVLTALNDPPKRIAGRAVESVERLDGVKLNLSGNAWLMFRASGTEPLLRIYCEAATEQDVKRILDGANEFVRGLE